VSHPLLVALIDLSVGFQVEEKRKREERRVREKAGKENQTPPTPSDSGKITPRYMLTNQYGVDIANYSQSLTGTAMVSCILSYSPPPFAV